jgi:phosphonate transport system permease protein
MGETKAIRKPVKWKSTLAILVLAVLYFISYSGVKADFGELIAGWPNIVNLLAETWPPDWAYVQKIMEPMMQTLQMAILGTTFGSILAIPFTLLASRNVFKSAWVTGIARGFLNLVRTVPDLLFAGIFVAVVGIGPAAGVCALTFFSFGIVTKLAYESVEAIDPGPLEAMTAVGANKWQFIAYAIVPQALPSFIGYVLYTFEVCVRASAILGLVGAGGIGLQLQATLEQFQYTRMMTIVLITLVVVILIDTISAYVREKLL